MHIWPSHTAVATDTWADTCNKFPASWMNERGMHLLLDRWWGIWFDWCPQQTQQRSEPCGNRSWGACAILSDWCGLRCQKRSRIKLEGAQAHIVSRCTRTLNPSEIEVSEFAARHFRRHWCHICTRTTEVALLACYSAGKQQTKPQKNTHSIQKVGTCQRVFVNAVLKKKITTDVLDCGKNHSRVSKWSLF